VALRVVIVDNGSRREDVDLLRKGLPAGCQLVELPRNVGFAEGMNVVLRLAAREGADYAWLLNNDAFAEPDCLPLLVAALRADPNLAVVTPKLVGTDGLEQHAGASVNWSTGGNDLKFAEQLGTPAPHGHWLTGTALLVRVRALGEVGVFDPAYFAYWEDVDLCVRLTAKGYGLRAVPEACCLHLGSTSTGGTESPFARHLITRNAWLFLRKHLRGRTRWSALLALLASGLVTAASMAQRGKDRQASAILAAVLAILQNSVGPPVTLDISPRLRRWLLWKWWRLVDVLNHCRALIATCP
jgi:GT2 family glycosyltransferase